MIIWFPKIRERELVQEGVPETEKTLTAAKVESTVGEIVCRRKDGELRELQPYLNRAWYPSRTPDRDLPPM